MEIILLLVLPILLFVFVFVYKLTHGYGYGGRPYSKKVDSKCDESLSSIQNAAMTSNLYNLAKGGCGAAGVGGDDEIDEAQYRAYREELAAYDDFVASLDMDD
jgi:hypothetical protein